MTAKFRDNAAPEIFRRDPSLRPHISFCADEKHPYQFSCLGRYFWIDEAGELMESELFVNGDLVPQPMEIDIPPTYSQHSGEEMKTVRQFIARELKHMNI